MKIVGTYGFTSSRTLRRRLVTPAYLAATADGFIERVEAFLDEFRLARLRR